MLVSLLAADLPKPAPFPVASRVGVGGRVVLSFPPPIVMEGALGLQEDHDAVAPRRMQLAHLHLRGVHTLD